MASSFSIKDLLADDNSKAQLSMSNSTSPFTTPGSTPPPHSPTNIPPCKSLNTSPPCNSGSIDSSPPGSTPPPHSPTNNIPPCKSLNTSPPCNSIDARSTPCSSHVKKTRSTSPKQQQVQHPFSDEIEVTVLKAGVAARSSRKRYRDGGSLGSSSESEDFQSDTGSLSPALSCIGSSPPDSGNKVKRLRTAFTTTQLRSLEYYFRVCPYPDNMGRDVISRVTGIDESKIQVWFQNRRARYRKREKALQPPTPSLFPSPTPPAVIPPHILTAQKATQPHTVTAPQAAHPHTITAPNVAHSHTTTAPQASHPPHFTSALLQAYYATLAYHNYCAQSTPTLPHSPHLTHYPGQPFPHHFSTPSPSTQLSKVTPPPPRHSPSPNTSTETK